MATEKTLTTKELQEKIAQHTKALAELQALSTKITQDEFRSLCKEFLDKVEEGGFHTFDVLEELGVILHGTSGYWDWIKDKQKEGKPTNGPKQARAAKGTAVKKAKAEPYYVDPSNPNNTSGKKGPPAKWLKALMDAGHSKEEFLIKK